jgi:predicted adenine nucleotide alpha hydrolase (AANH) superfamily ATPase
MRALMLQCIPMAKYDSWEKYQWVGNYDEPPAWGKLYPNGQRNYYQRSRIDDLKVEFSKSSLNAESTQEEIAAFFNPKIAANEDYVSKLQAVEDWCESFKVMDKEGKKSLYTKRADYYKSQALLMDPPLEAEALKQCESFGGAVRIAREPTSKSWSILEGKLKIERVAVEEKLAKKRQHDAVQEFRRQLRQDYQENVARRMMQDAPEQLLVSELAEAVIKDLQQTRAQIANEDLIHVFFRRVFDTYQASDSKPEGKRGKYQLIMDDARYVFYKNFRPMIQGEIQPNIPHPALQVKCPGCPGDVGTRSFPEHMRHIHIGHLYDGSDLSNFSANRGSEDFAWMYREWPRNLPMLASHHESTGCWNPDDCSAYQHKYDVSNLLHEA